MEINIKDGEQYEGKKASKDGKGNARSYLFACFIDFISNVVGV